MCARYRDAMPLIAAQAKAPDVALKASGTLARAVAGVLKTIHLTPPKPVALFVRPNNHILGETFHSMAALRYGAYIAKLSVAPLSKSVRDLTNRPVEGALGDALRDMVVDFFASTSAEIPVTRATLHRFGDDARRGRFEAVARHRVASPHEPIAKISFPGAERLQPWPSRLRRRCAVVQSVARTGRPSSARLDQPRQN